MIIRNIRLSNKDHSAKALQISGNSLKIIEDQKEGLDGQGLFVYPALADTHTHFPYHFFYQRKLKLPKNEKITIDYLKSIADFHAGWLIGFGWLNLDQLPSTEKILQAFPNYKIYLSRIDGHQVLTSEDTIRPVLPQIKQEQIISKNPYLVVEDAVTSLRALIPELSKEQLRQLYLESEKDFFSQGIVEVHDSGDKLAHLITLEEMYEKNELSILCTASYSDYDCIHPIQPIMSANQKLKLYSIKTYLDGSLGSQTAAMKSIKYPGMLLKTDEELLRFLKICKAKKMSPKIHAIGENATEQALRCLSQEVFSNFPMPPRIEHAEYISEQSIKLCAELGVELAIQPCHLIEDVKTIKKYYPDHPNLMPLSSLKKHGVRFHFGSDTPVEDIDPRRNIWAALHLVPVKEKLNFQDTLASHFSSTSLSDGSFFLTERPLNYLENLETVDKIPHNPLSVLTVLRGKIVYNRLL